MTDSVAIISVGEELTAGRIVDTNAAWLATRLGALGFAVPLHVTVGDDVQAIIGLLDHVAREVDAVIVTGGLGPTADDRTRDAVSHLGRFKYRLDEHALERFCLRLAARKADGSSAHDASDQLALEARARRLRERMPGSNEAQFLVPDTTNATALANDVGVALGFAVDVRLDPRPGVASAARSGALIVVLPGVPAEMKAMFEDAVVPVLRARFANRRERVIRLIRCFGAWESVIDGKVRDLLEASDPRGAITVSGSTITLAFTTEADPSKPDAALARLDAVEDDVRARLGPLAFGVGEDTLPGVTVGALIDRGLTVGLAESCTAGLATHLLGQVPGASATLVESRVTYAYEAKTASLGVDRKVLEEHGAVSPEVARAMALGIVANAGGEKRIDCGIGITGIAGPDGGTAEKPVGLVYIACVIPGRDILVRKLHLRGDRVLVQQRAALAAIDLLRLMLAGHDDETILTLGRLPEPHAQAEPKD